jgi:inosine-uridine nucleoside N-ribohydrolase
MVMKESESQQRIKEISIMGGLYRETGKPTGDIERSVEFNFYSDP